jgi:hypothetical protein
MFRRAANDVARIEDALVFGGRPAPNTPPPMGIAGIDPVYTVTGDGAVAGVFWPVPGTLDRRDYSQALLPIPFVANGGQVIDRVVAAILALERNGQNGPFACVLSHELYAAICLPSPNLVLPRDRILPFLQGPLLRSSTIAPRWGAVIALNANSIEIVVARDMHVRFLQTTLDPRVVFRVSERVGLRIKDDRAIALVRA